MSLRSTFHRLTSAVLSANPSAWFGMFVLGVSPISRIIDKIIPRRELNNKIGPCLYIVCPPRSGGTIVYQVLTRLIPSVYITNLHSLFPRHATPILNRLNLFQENKSGFKNYYGYSYGFAGVNEGNSSISKICATHNISAIRARFMKFYNRLVRNSSKPLIFKNVRHYNRIEELHEAVPELIFVRVRRSIEQVIQSEYKAYKELKYFHPIPKSIEHLYGKIPPLEFAVKQAAEIEKEIDNQLSKINPNNFIEITYEEFCDNPESIAVKILREKLNLQDVALRERKFELNASFSKKVSEEEEIRLKELLNAEIG